MSALRPGLACAALSYALLACGDDADSGAAGSAELLPGLGVGAQLLLIDTVEERAFFRAADVAQGESSATEAKALPPNPRLLVAREVYEAQAWVLGEGLQGVGQGPTLTLLDPEAEATSYALGEVFDAVAQSPDGRYAVAHHVLGADALVFGAQRVSVVDVQDDKSWSRTVSTPAGVPGLIAVSPKLTLSDDSSQHWLVVGSPAHVAFVGLDGADAAEHIVQLTGLDRAPLAEPEQLVFDADGAHLYVRASHAEDVFMFAFAPASTGGPTLPELTSLPAGGVPLDMALAGPDATQRLVVLVEDGMELRSFALDGDTTPQRFALAQQAARLHAFESGEGRAILLYAPGSPWLGLAELSGAPEVAPELRYVRTQAPVQSLVALADSRYVLLVHDQTTLTVLDIDNGARMLVNLRAGLEHTAYTAGADVLWSGAPGDYLAATLDLASGAVHEVLLDAPLAQIVLVAEADRAALVHPDGSATLFDLFEPALDAAVTLPPLQ